MVRTTKVSATASGPRRSVAWPHFVKEFTAVLGALDEDQFLVVAVKRTNRFVQFAAQGAFGMRAETTSNAYLAESERLSVQDIAALGAAGWLSPTGNHDESTPEKDPDGSPNFFVEFDTPVPFAAVAELAVRTLADILGVPHPGFLEYDAYDAEGNAIVFPSLGLRRTGPKPRVAAAVPLPERLLATLRDSTGIADLDFDDDGDIGVRFGSVIAFARLIGAPASVRVFSRILADIEVTPELLSRLNYINVNARHLHFFHRNEAVFAVADIPAEPFVSEQVAGLFAYFCEITDGIDSVLQSEFGGCTTFVESLPSSVKH